MTFQRTEHLQDLFIQAIEVPSEQRNACLREHCRAEKRRAKHTSMAQVFVGSIDRYALSSTFEAWVHNVAQAKRRAMLLSQQAKSKQYLVALAEADDAVLLKTCLQAFREALQQTKAQELARQAEAWHAQLRKPAG